MKKLSAILLSIIIFAILAIIRFHSSGCSAWCGETKAGLNGNNQMGHSSELFSAEGFENSKARREWEQKRLANPVTGLIPRGMRLREMAFASLLPTDATMKTDSLTAPWTQRGPWNLGGRTRAFAMDADNDSILLAGGVSGGIWRSTDAGSSWARMTLPASNPGVADIIQDKRPGKTANWYAISGEGYGTSASGGGAFYLGTGIYKSTDSGLTWNILSSTNSGSPQSFDNVWDIGWRVSLDRSDTINDVVFAAVIGAIFHSANGGTSWTTALGSTTTNLSYFTNVMTTPAGVTYAALSSDGTDAGIWRTPDGAAWTNINPSFLPAFFGRIVSAYNPLDEDRLYFLVASTDSSGKLTTDFQGDPEWNMLWRYTYLSGDGSGAGGMWENLTANIPATGGIFDKFIVQGGYNLVVSVNPDDTAMVIIGGTNLYRSTSSFNDSVNTTHIGGYAVGASTPTLMLGLYPNQHPDHHVLFFHPGQANVLFCGNDGGLWRTDDVTDSSVAWTVLNNGYMVSQFYTVGLDHGTPGSDIVIGGLQDNGTYYTNTNVITDSWKWISGGDGSHLAIVNGGGAYYLSKQLGRIAKCAVDANGNVTAFQRIDPIGADNYEFINPFVLDPNNQDVMYVPAGNKIWRNSDLSVIPLNNEWDSISTNWTMLPDSLPAGLQITSIAVSGSPANRLYVGTDSKYIYRIDSADAPAPVVTYVAATQMPTGGFVSCLAVHPDDGDKIVAVFSNYEVYSIWYSTNAGLNWARAAGNLEQNISGSGNGPSIRWVQIIPVDSGTLYLAATSTGLFGTDSLNGTATIWTQLGTNSIGNMIVDMIDHRRSDGLTAIATHGYGIWTSTIGGNWIYREKGKVNQEPLLSVYPNPVTDESSAIVNLADRQKVVAEVIGISGNVLIRKEGIFDAGSHKVLEDLNLLPSGVYFCRMEGGNWKETIKFLVP